MIPFFSIIIPTYNRASFIAKTIDSVIQQSYTDWELIIIDDGSTDDTKDIVEGFKEGRISYIWQENQERSAARNKGINASKGEWICFLDSDDLYKKNHLETFYNCINTDNNNEPKMYLTRTEILNNGITNIHPSIDNNSPNVLKEIWNKFILMNNVCVHTSILQNNKFDVKFNLWEDTHLWLRIASQYKVHQLETITTIQIVHEESSVQELFNNVNIENSSKEIEAINDLFDQHNHIISKYLTDKDKREYISRKYNMYLYLSRQKKLLLTSLQIWTKAFLNSPSFYLIAEFPKIFINSMGIGVYAKK